MIMSLDHFQKPNFNSNQNLSDPAQDYHSLKILTMTIVTPKSKYDKASSTFNLSNLPHDFPILLPYPHTCPNSLIPSHFNYHKCLPLCSYSAKCNNNDHYLDNPVSPDASTCSPFQKTLTIKPPKLTQYTTLQSNKRLQL